MLLDVLYLVAFVALLPWVAWRKFSGGRPVAAAWTRFTGGVTVVPQPAGAARIWLHGVSVGEVQLLSALAAEIGRQAEAAGRTVDCVLSSSTTTGLEVAAKRVGAARSFPCPLDFTWAVDRARRRGIPIVVANARMSERSAAGYARIRPLARRMLGRVGLVVARSQADADRFAALGAPEVVVTGSMKFDGVRSDRDTAEIERLRRLAGFAGDDIVFLAGSTQAPEERLAAEAFVALRAAHPALRLVIVPRHVERAAEIGAVLDGLGLRWQPRSRIERDAADPAARVLLVDATGELAWWWGTATIAFVGGSLDGKRGGQNMLEPAAYGAAVSFGPHTRNFQDEVSRLLAAEAAVVVADGRELRAFVARCLQQPEWAAALGRRAATFVAAQRGATATTARLILDRLAAAAARRA